jgi:hypothetical protein
MSNNILDYLITYKYQDKIRLGNNSDGGYVIANISNYDCYVSAGVSNEESFSRDFIEKFGMTRFNSYAFDGTIDKFPYKYTKNITFIKKNIGPIASDNIANLGYIMENYNDIFLKMDIEGCEYEWILGLTSENLNKFKQIVVEFHGINDDSWNALYEDKVNCLKKISETHYLLHVHGNNYSKTTNFVPDTIETTYVRKDLFDSCPPLNDIMLPIYHLDYPCDSTNFDYGLCFPPFYYE